MSKNDEKSLLEIVFDGLKDTAGNHLNKRLRELIPQGLDWLIGEGVETAKVYKEYVLNGKKTKAELLLAKERKNYPVQVSILEESFDKYKTNKNDKKAQKELIGIVMASSIHAVEMKQLTTLCDKDGVKIPDGWFVWQPLIEKLTTKRIVESFNLILENNVSLLSEIEEKLITSFLEVLNHNLILNGQYVHIDNVRFKAALLK